MANHPAIYIDNLQKTYTTKKGTEKEALKGVNLEIPQGSFFGLLGPNGAGKSTLINILAGITIKTSGNAAIFGHDITTSPRLARKAIGIVPQELILDPFFPAAEALEYTAGYYGIPKNKRRTNEILKAVGLQDQATSIPRSLSGGMRRRLLIAKALVHSPKVLVLDEPTAGVDVELRRQLWDYVIKLNKQGTTILLTTHYLEEAEELCDHIAIINHGNIIANDSKQNIMKIIDQKTIIITPTTPLKSIPKELKSFKPTLNAEGSIAISYKASDGSIETLLTACKKAKITIRDITTQEADLEQIFRYVTKQAA